MIAARATLERNVILGAGVKVGVGTVLGGDPQDLKFKGEHTTVEIGEGTTIREYTTINRGTTQSFKTTVGKNCFLMSYVHLAHDCHIGDGVIISNGTQLAGHVTIDEKAIVSGLVAVHQFATIGRYSFIGGCSRVAKDVPPYVKAVGNPDQAVWAQQRGAGAQRLSRGGAARAQARVPAVLQVGAQLVAGARAGGGRAASVSGDSGIPGVFRSQRSRVGRLMAVRIGVVGAGALGFHHTRILREVPGAELVGFPRGESRRGPHKVSAELAA